MFDFLSEDELKNRLVIVWLLLTIVAITYFISTYVEVNDGVMWILVLLTFGYMGFEVFNHIKYRNILN